MHAVVLRSIADLIPSPRNARTHSAAQIEQIEASIAEFGFTSPILVDGEGIIAGHGRRAALANIYARGERVRLPGGGVLPEGEAPTIDVSGWSEAQRRAYMLADNKLALNAGWDEDMLAAELEALAGLDFDMPLIGFDEKEIERLTSAAEPEPSKAGSMAAEFLVPPFSVLNAREGWWQERKRAWLALGIKSEVGRGDNLLKMSDTMLEPDPEKRAAMQAARKVEGGGRHVPGGLAFGEMNIAPGAGGAPSGTSIFDPVLCELAYRWFSPLGGTVLDPFAGGSVRGVVCAALGRRYEGVDLRAEQVAANRAQWPAVANALGEPGMAGPVWHVGDSAAVIPGLGVEADMIFSCPPYGDLEVYSDDPADISNMGDEGFLEAYRVIIAAAVAKLKPNRFACFVIGDYRDKRGLYRDFVSRTIAAFRDAGAPLYNEAILVTATGSLAIRAGKQFRTTRKLGKTHQNVLVFVKGDPKKATAACGPVDVSGALATVEADEGDED